MPPSPDDPDNVTPNKRRREVAAILARGVRRLPCMDVAPEHAGRSPNPAERSLEASTPSRPHVTGG